MERRRNVCCIFIYIRYALDIPFPLCFMQNAPWLFTFTGTSPPPYLFNASPCPDHFCWMIGQSFHTWVCCQILWMLRKLQCEKEPTKPQDKHCILVRNKGSELKDFPGVNTPITTATASKGLPGHIFIHENAAFYKSLRFPTMHWGSNQALAVEIIQMCVSPVFFQFTPYVIQSSIGLTSSQYSSQ